MADRRPNPPPSVGWRVIRRQLTSGVSVVITIFLAVFLTTAALAITPRLFERVSNDALRETLSDPLPGQRNIAVSRATRLGPSRVDNPFMRLESTGESFAEQEMSDLVRSIISRQTYVADSMQFKVFPLPGDDEGPFPSFVRFRYQQGIEDELELVQGSLPQSRDPIPMFIGPGCPEDPGELKSFEETDDVDCHLEDVPHYEVAMTAETLSVLNFGLGDMVILRPDTNDGLLAQIDRNDLDYQVILTVSGVVELTDIAKDYWYGDERLHRAAITENADLRIIFATGLIDPDDYRRLLRDLTPANWRYTWRYFVDPELIDSENAAELLADVSNLQIGFRSVSALSSGYSVVTSLPELIRTFIEQRQLTASFVSTVLVGLFATAIAVILLLAGLVTLRNRASIVLIRNRGGSRGQLTLTTFYQGVLLTAPAAVLGYVFAAWLVPDTEFLVPYRIVFAFAAAAIGVFVYATSALIRRRLGLVQREQDSALARPSRRRLVIDAAIVVFAVASVTILRRRGLTDGLTVGATFDPLLAVAPALLGLATGVVLLRLYPYLIRAVSWTFSKGRGLVAFVGFRRILQQAPAARVPLLAIVIAVSVAVFSSIANTSIADGQKASAFQSVGADYRITGSGPKVALPRALDVSAVDSIEAAAFGVRDSDVPVTVRGQQLDVDFLALEAAQYQEVTQELEQVLPEFILAEPQPGSGSVSNAIPVIVSSGWPASDPVQVGDTFVLNLGRLQPTVIVRGIRDLFPSLPVGRPFVIANLAAIDALSEPVSINRTVMYLRGPESAGETISSTIDTQTVSTAFASRYDVIVEVSDAPLVRAVDNGLKIIFGLSLAFAMLAAVSSLALSTAARRRDFGYLRTLGLDSRQATGVTIVEQLPMLAVGAAVGSALGIGIILVLKPAFELDAFTGGLVPASLQYEWATIVAAFLLLLFVLAVSVLIFVLVSRNDDLGRILRVGDE